jgi:cytosine/adenosine deaminase-related metal-dependent hydrolase
MSDDLDSKGSTSASRTGRSDDGPTRRGVLKSSAGLLAGAATVAALPEPVVAQSATGADAELARVLAARRVLLKGGVVLTLDQQIGDFAQADLLIEDGKIREIRPTIAVSDDIVAVDAAKRIIIPGFVDTHSHSYQGLLRDTLPNGIVDPDYNRDIQNNMTLHYEPDDAYAGMLSTALALIDMGTTSMVDLSQVNHTPEHTDAIIRALQESGMRAVFGYSRGVGPRTQYPQDAARLRRTYFSSSDQLLTLALGVGLDPKIYQFARENGLRAIAHLRLNPAPMLALASAGLLRPGDEFIHCTHLNDEAWRTMKDSGCRTSHSPPLEMAMAHGMPSIQEALDHGMRPSLSSDHAATVGQDMFGIMRTVFNLQRLFILQRRRNGEQNPPPLLTCRDVLEFATIEGAHCADLGSKVGTLTPGKQADIVMLRADRINVWPLNNAPSAVVNIMNPGHVETVFIAGKARKWRGDMVGVDMPRVLRSVEQARDAVFRRSGFQLNLVG